MLTKHKYGNKERKELGTAEPSNLSKHGGHKISGIQAPQGDMRGGRRLIWNS